MSKARIYLSLGSNLGDRAANLARAVAALGAAPGVRVVARSRVRETEPVGVAEAFRELKFLNMAVAVETDLAPRALLAVCQRIEKDLGRMRPAPRNSPRPVDIDIVAGDGPLVVDEPPDLVVPHPRARERAFVLEPLAEIAPNLVWPEVKTHGR